MDFKELPVSLKGTGRSSVCNGPLVLNQKLTNVTIWISTSYKLRFPPRNP